MRLFPWAELRKMKSAVHRYHPRREIQNY